jgi:hypothetical protein
LREIVELIIADAPDGEVLGIRMGEIKPGDGGVGSIAEFSVSVMPIASARQREQWFLDCMVGRR